MPITLDLMATGLVTSSLFLMAISIPRILMTLALSVTRFFFLSRIERSDQMFRDLPTMRRWIPDSVIRKWREPKEKISLISEELKKLSGLGKSFVEGAMAAVFLIVAALYLGVEGEAGMVIALTVVFLIASVVLGAIIIFRYVAWLTLFLNKFESAQAKPQADVPEPKAPSV